MHERVGATPIRDKQIDAAVAVEIGKRDIPRVAAPRETIARRGVSECAIEIVAIDRPLAVANEEEIEIAIVIEIDEDRFARAVHVGDPRPRRHVLERPIPPIAEQMTTTLAADCEKIEPAVVVVVDKGGEGSAVRERDAGCARDVTRESAAHAKEMRYGFPLLRGPDGDEDIIRAV